MNNYNNFQKKTNEEKAEFYISLAQKNILNEKKKNIAGFEIPLNIIYYTLALKYLNKNNSRKSSLTPKTTAYRNSIKQNLLKKIGNIQRETTKKINSSKNKATQLWTLLSQKIKDNEPEYYKLTMNLLKNESQKNVLRNNSSLSPSANLAPSLPTTSSLTSSSANTSLTTSLPISQINSSLTSNSAPLPTPLPKTSTGYINNINYSNNSSLINNYNNYTENPVFEQLGKNNFQENINQIENLSQVTPEIREMSNNVTVGTPVTPVVPVDRVLKEIKEANKQNNRELSSRLDAIEEQIKKLIYFTNIKNNGSALNTQLKQKINSIMTELKKEKKVNNERKAEERRQEALKINILSLKESVNGLGQKVESVTTNVEGLKKQLSQGQTTQQPSTGGAKKRSKSKSKKSKSKKTTKKSRKSSSSRK